jgi:arsenate reductase
MIVYGIPNCNTVKKAQDWLKQNNVDYTFHDFKKMGITEAKLKAWTKEVSWQALVNKRGTTWRQLDAKVQEGVIDETSAIVLMLEKNSVIKRPVVETKNGVVLGFDEDVYQSKFA